MNNSVDVSVIVVSWNTSSLLLDCIQSIKDQTGQFQKEVIVVDNNSSDGSQAAVKDAYPFVTVIENTENLGFAKANNIGMQESRAKYICLVNSDVRVLPDCLQRLVNFMEKNISVGISSPLTLSPDMSVQDTCRKLPTLWNNICDALYLNRLFPESDRLSGEHMKFFDHRSIRKVEGLTGCCLMIRKAALDQVGLFDEQFFIYFEETDLCKRFGEAGWDIVFFPDASIIHHHGASSAKDPVRFNIEQMKSRMQYWKKHNSPLTVKTFQTILLIQHGVRLILRSILHLFSTRSRRTDIRQHLTKHCAVIKLIFTGQYDNGK